MHPYIYIIKRVRFAHIYITIYSYLFEMGCVLSSLYAKWVSVLCIHMYTYVYKISHSYQH